MKLSVHQTTPKHQTKKLVLQKNLFTSVPTLSSDRKGKKKKRTTKISQRFFYYKK